ncbi:uncharacterized protein LOC120196086 isoform X2 [Hibiscus syriacus]|uniref:uncharacterized protein LOC120196086 isoform X2 n=1 Tax=Hibiscus syriacus TaxID=106335 RepID=UPI0019219E53|nr:uncharacterized protein LOC120196086 isoform X2 [Hibiscus syriacus]
MPTYVDSTLGKTFPPSRKWSMNGPRMRYMEHPNEKVARASHLMFVAFMASGKEPDDQLVSLKEQLVFYYMQRSLGGYPGITPFEGMDSGVAALVRHLPAGSPTTYYCIHCLVDKANNILGDLTTLKYDDWKNWQGGPEPCKKNPRAAFATYFPCRYTGITSCNEVGTAYYPTTKNSHCLTLVLKRKPRF